MSQTNLEMILKSQRYTVHYSSSIENGLRIDGFTSNDVTLCMTLGKLHHIIWCQLPHPLCKSFDVTSKIPYRYSNLVHTTFVVISKIKVLYLISNTVLRKEIFKFWYLGQFYNMKFILKHSSGYHVICNCNMPQRYHQENYGQILQFII